MEAHATYEPQPGKLVAGRYQLVAKVGEGGMGSVWRARHVELESEVALKLMSPSIAEQPEALKRFLREARAAARLTSLHVVQVFDYGVDGSTPFLVMELLHGENLRERIDRQGALSPQATLRVMRHACRALEKAHAEGIVHRDLKPENLFAAHQEEEIVKVLDFGVAKLSAAGAPSSNTRTGAVLGTPFYMSPEQARGIKAVDHRADVWSLGIIAFECLTGRLPFDSEAFGDLVLKICTLPAPEPSSVADVPDGFDAWFARATAKDPELRFADVLDMFNALESVLEPGSRPVGIESVARAETVPASPNREEQLSRMGTDVTASQTLMGAVPKRGMSPRAWMGLALVALMGVTVATLLWAWPRSTSAESVSVAAPDPVVGTAPHVATSSVPAEASPGAAREGTAPSAISDAWAAPPPRVTLAPVQREKVEKAEEPRAAASVSIPTPRKVRPASPTKPPRRKPAAPARSAETARKRSPASNVAPRNSAGGEVTKPAERDLFSDPD